MKRSSVLLTLAQLAILTSAARADIAGLELPTPVAIVNARVVTQPGQFIDGAVIVIKNGRITAVGPDVTPPPDAEQFDASGMIVYPGFIDGLTNRGLNAADRTAEEIARLADDDIDVTQDVQSATVQAQRRLIHPDWQSAELYDPASAKRDDARAAGFTAALVAPEVSIFSGVSAVVSLGEAPARRSILRPAVAQHAAFVTQAGGGRSFRGGYPVTTMGAIAAFRQALLDAAWQRDLIAWSSRHPEGDRPAFDRALDALQPILDGQLPIAFLANSEDEIHRALNIAKEFKIKPIIVGGKEAWKAADRLKSENVPVLLSLKWSDEIEKPKKPVESLKSVIIDEGDALARPTDRSPVFDDAWQDQAWETHRVFKERERLRNEEIDNAKMLHEAGVRFAFASYELKSPKDVVKTVHDMIEHGLTEDAALQALTLSAANVLGIDSDVGLIAPGKRANLTLLSDRLAEKKSEVKWVFVEGRPFDVGQKEKKHGKGDKDGGDDASSEDDQPASQPVPGDSRANDNSNPSPEAAASSTSTAPTTTTAPTTQEAEHPEFFPEFADEIESDRKPRFQTGGTLLIRNATLLTLTGGDLPETDLFIHDGRIAAIGKNLPAPADITTLDLRGYLITPGLIDPHSHICSSGGLNEASLSATPEVRVADVTNSKDLSAFRALAGGVTMIHTMHGSANTIGGQNVVLRMMYGRPAAEWRFTAAPKSVKFALGENVKQSNGDRLGTRYPNSRMGVESVFYRSFDRAMAYAHEHENFTAEQKLNHDPRPVRRDLRLEALCDIQKGNIWVHCHCYRADEVLRLLTMAETYGFRIAVLQHILEGYRVIPEIFRHGASASTFSDWWAYKIEAFDATPFNAARLSQGGVVTTINSDSAEVMRHLNLEAAKSMRFGGLSPNDALRLCTLNGAIQLGIDKEVGSIEVGKRADLAIFDGHPLDTFSKCVMTLIDGEVYFQHPDFQPTAPATPLAIKSFVLQQEPLPIKSSPNQTYRIGGGVIHPIDGPEIKDGVIVIENGKIKSVGPNVPGQSAADSIYVDASDHHIYPGLICAGVPLGLLEIDSVNGTVDASDIARFQPDLHTLSGFNPFSALIDVARTEGVTNVLVSAGGGVIQSRGGLVQLDGWSMPEARVEAPETLFVQLPSKPTQKPRRMDDKEFEKRNKAYAESLAEIESVFRMARQYVHMKTLSANGASEPPRFDRRLDAMTPFILRERPIFFRAGSYKDIREALRFSDKYQLTPVIFGGREAWKLADDLADRKVDVVIARSMSMPAGEFEPWNSVYKNAATLHRHGVRFCFTVAEPSLTKQLGIEAGMAVAHGLDPAAAMTAITLDAAKILGVADQLGSLTPGKTANLIITTDSPLQASNCVVAEFIAGRPVDLSNKHTREDDKFRHRPTPTLPPARNDLNGPPQMHVK